MMKQDGASSMNYDCLNGPYIPDAAAQHRQQCIRKQPNSMMRQHVAPMMMKTRPTIELVSPS